MKRLAWSLASCLVLSWLIAGPSLAAADLGGGTNPLGEVVEETTQQVDEIKEEITAPAPAPAEAPVEEATQEVGEVADEVQQEVEEAAKATAKVVDEVEQEVEKAAAPVKAPVEEAAKETAKVVDEVEQEVDRVVAPVREPLEAPVEAVTQEVGTVVDKVKEEADKVVAPLPAPVKQPVDKATKEVVKVVDKVDNVVRNVNEAAQGSGGGSWSPSAEAGPSPVGGSATTPPAEVSNADTTRGKAKVAGVTTGSAKSARRSGRTSTSRDTEEVAAAGQIIEPAQVKAAEVITPATEVDEPEGSGLSRTGVQILSWLVVACSLLGTGAAFASRERSRAQAAAS
ncbi:MAG: hypothetical protein ACRDJL_06945 [Actinomycetota bacterium]